MKCQEQAPEKRQKKKEWEVRRLLRVLEQVLSSRSPRRCWSSPPPPRQAGEPCAIPGERRKPVRGRGGARAGGAQQTRQLHPRLCSSGAFGGAIGQGARKESGTEGSADRPTDGRPRTRRRTELRTAPVTHRQGHTQTRTLARSHPPASLLVRRRLEPALAGVRERARLLMTPREEPWTCAVVRGCWVSPSR